MTGNDIIDLNIAQIPGGTKRLRFIKKIFTSREQELINSGKAEIWDLWAMKEAVYKAHHQRFNLPRKYDPKRIEITLNENRSQPEGEYGGYKYWCSGKLTLEYIHYTASCIPEEFIYQEIHPASTDIKTRMLRLLSEKSGVDINDICLSKNENLIPHLSYRNKDLKVAFSISHHGKFKAFSFQLINY